MDFSSLNRGEKIAGVSGILLILIMFIFDWFGLKFSAGGRHSVIYAEGGAQCVGLLRLHRHRPVHHGIGRDRRSPSRPRPRPTSACRSR